NATARLRGSQRTISTLVLQVEFYGYRRDDRARMSVEVAWQKGRGLEPTHSGLIELIGAGGTVDCHGGDASGGVNADHQPDESFDTHSPHCRRIVIGQGRGGGQQGG